MAEELPILAFRTPEAFRAWLEENHATAKGIRIRFFKKASGKPSIVYAEALDEALSFGWIDGQLKSEGPESYLQRFTPRRPKSSWSKINREHVARLEREGRMRPAGLREVARAKADGRWDRAYEPPSRATLPDDFVAELSRPKNRRAKAFLATLPRENVYAIHYRLHTAKKEETRKARIVKLIAQLDAGEPLVVRPPRKPPEPPKRRSARAG